MSLNRRFKLIWPPFLRVALGRVALLMLGFSLTRLLFCLWNQNLYVETPFRKLAWAFLLGLRFDLSAIALTNAALFLLWMLPAWWYRSKLLSTFELALFGVVNFITLGSNVADSEFVKFIGKRSAYDILLIQQDLEQQGLSVLMSYWYLLLTVIFGIVLLVWFSPRMPKTDHREVWWQGLLFRLGFIFLVVTAARGGYQFKPLHPMHAYFSTEHELGLLVLNTPFNVIKSRPKNGIERQRFFSDDQVVEENLKSMNDLTRPPLALAKDFNVVILLVESLSSEYMGAVNDFEGYTPFLDSLTKEKGAFFYKFNVANSRRSIEGLPAVVCGIPAIMAEPVITSDFSNDRFDCLPHVLARRGYSTYFLHGAHNGSMHFDTFSHIAGFENFVGLNEFPDKNSDNFDPYWGVLDEPMLQYATSVLDQAKKPALVTVFTLRSHHPYFIPKKYAGRFPKGTLEIHESMGYADYSIQQFFATARSKSWFNKTLFVITGDHTQKFYHKEYGNLLGSYRVPLILYAPGLANAQIPFDPERITQHIDVLPSLFDLLGLEVSDRLLVGQSVFDLKHEGFAYNFNSPEYMYVDPHLYMNMSRTGDDYNVKKNLGDYHFSEDAVPREELDKANLRLKSAVHYLNEGLIRNSLYTWRRKK